MTACLPGSGPHGAAPTHPGAHPEETVKPDPVAPLRPPFLCVESGGLGGPLNPISLVPHRKAQGCWNRGRGSSQAAASQPCPHLARRGVWAGGHAGGFPHPAPCRQGHSSCTKGSCPETNSFTRPLALCVELGAQRPSGEQPLAVGPAPEAAFEGWGAAAAPGNAGGRHIWPRHGLLLPTGPWRPPQARALPREQKGMPPPYSSIGPQPLGAPSRGPGEAAWAKGASRSPDTAT